MPRSEIQQDRMGYCRVCHVVARGRFSPGIIRMTFWSFGAMLAGLWTYYRASVAPMRTHWIRNGWEHLDPICNVLSGVAAFIMVMVFALAISKRKCKACGTRLHALNR